MQAVEVDQINAKRVDEGDVAEILHERICEIIMAGAQAVMISIGHRSGLCDPGPIWFVNLKEQSYDSH
jgi:hypothetical protein